MITSANLKDTTAPQSVNNFDPAEIGSNQYMIGTYHNYFQEDMITVMAPVTQGFYTKGYLIIHSPVSLINERCRTLMVFLLELFSCCPSSSCLGSISSSIGHCC